MSDLLTFDEIAPFLHTNYIGKNIIHFDTIGSTNDQAKITADDVPSSNGTVLISEEQTAGRGRLGRKWISTKGKNILMSIILKPDMMLKDAVKITQIAAAALVCSIRTLGIDAYIKWPNDIIVNNKKVCGILTETKSKLSKIQYIILGIGINVNINSNEIPQDLIKTASSLYIESKNKISRKKLTADVINNFEKFYNKFLIDNDFNSSLEICRKYSAVLNKKIYVINKNKKYEALAVDINNNGELIVEYEDLRREKLNSNEISIRGEHEYI